jgi:hypothetical protein
MAIILDETTGVVHHKSEEIPGISAAVHGHKLTKSVQKYGCNNVLFVLA